MFIYHRRAQNLGYDAAAEAQMGGLAGISPIKGRATDYLASETPPGASPTSPDGASPGRQISKQSSGMFGFDVSVARTTAPYCTLLLGTPHASACNAIFNSYIKGEAFTFAV